MNCKLGFFSTITLVLLFACNNPQADKAPTPVENPDLAGYELLNIPGSSAQMAKEADELGNVKETGFISDNRRTGTWATYHSNNRVKTLTSYINGKKNGLYMEMNDRGQIQLQCEYLNDNYDGRWASFKFGSRPLKVAHYKNGILHGVYEEYNESTGKKIKEVMYKGGKMDGYFRAFNPDDGTLVMEYEYKNGEKISGGVVEKSEGK